MSKSNAKLSLVVPIKPSTEAQKTTRTVTSTIIVTPESIGEWRNPPFQRPLKMNAKVMEVCDQIKADSGIIPGILTIGVISDGSGRKAQYLLDGQHRRAAFLESGCEEGAVDVRYCEFDTMAEMGEEFVRLNSRLVTMRADDVLRGLDASSEILRRIRKRSPFVGYDYLRRNPSAPILSMSAPIKMWKAASSEVPSLYGISAVGLISSMTDDDVDKMTGFLNLCHAAWGPDNEYARLWASLNLSLVGWIYRRTVLGVTTAAKKTVRMTPDQFKKCVMQLSADPHYIDWLMGRALRERDRAAAYARIKNIMTKRYVAETGNQPFLPAPSWAPNAKGNKRDPGGDE